MQRNMQNKCEAIPDDVNSLYSTDEKESAEDSVPRNRFTVKMTEKVKKMSAKDVWLGSSIYARTKEHYDRLTVKLVFKASLYYLFR